MAIVIKQILCQLHGKAEENIFRVQYGRQFVHSVPSKHRMSKSAAFKNEQSKFGLTVRFAGFVNSVIELSNVWRIANVPGVNCYQKIIKNNLAFSVKDKLTASNIITPAGSDFPEISSVTIANNSIIFPAEFKSE